MKKFILIGSVVVASLVGCTSASSTEVVVDSTNVVDSTHVVVDSIKVDTLKNKHGKESSLAEKRR